MCDGALNLKNWKWKINEEHKLGNCYETTATKTTAKYKKANSHTHDVYRSNVSYDFIGLLYKIAIYCFFCLWRSSSLCE